MSWHGRVVEDDAEFVRYLQGPVRSRLRDDAHRSVFEADLRALATTDMSESKLRELLASEPPREDWEIGESLAECVLEDSGAVWPSNTERDKRTPKASLPGADLVGFLVSGQDVRLALGEVKTSSSPTSPPNVMSGRSGMIDQIDNLASRLEIHWSLLRWLHFRCHGTQYWPHYETAVKRYLATDGRDIALLGVLLRDTEPNELDLQNRAAALAARVSVPTVVELTAWYLPRAVSTWARTVEEAPAA